MMTAIRIAFLALVLTGPAMAQTPGLGETRPAVPDVIKSDSVKEREPVTEPRPQAESDRALSRCQQLSGSLREDCLRQERERSAGAGASRPVEPATAPPPQNPR
jgi:hypothetical protein